MQFNLFSLCAFCVLCCTALLRKCIQCIPTACSSWIAVVVWCLKEDAHNVLGILKIQYYVVPKPKSSRTYAIARHTCNLQKATQEHALLLNEHDGGDERNLWSRIVDQKRTSLVSHFWMCDLWCGEMLVRTAAKPSLTSLRTGSQVIVNIILYIYIVVDAKNMTNATISTSFCYLFHLQEGGVKFKTCSLAKSSVRKRLEII